MMLNAGQELLLKDKNQKRIGIVTIERLDGDLLLGEFMPGPAFPSVEQLFRDFEEAVNLQALSVVDTLDSRIAALGLTVTCPNKAQPLPIHDVQIWSDGGISCKFSDNTPPGVNGVTKSTTGAPTS